MPQLRYSIGKEGFIWFIGVVEDRADPEQLGRVRVRCFGWHTENRELIPTDSLPWAHVLQPPTNPAAYTPKNGDYVMGFFMDAESTQNPVVMGVLPGKPTAKPDFSNGFSDSRTSFGDQPVKEPYPKAAKLNEPTLSRLSRNKIAGTIIETRKKNLKKNVKSARGATWSEPEPTFAPVYPFNYAHESESGHAFELDDTPGKERVQLAHKIGAFIEFDAQGNRVEKVIKDNYTIIMGADNIYIGGKCNITIDGDCNLKVGGKFNVEAAEINMSASGAVNIKGAKISGDASTTMNMKAGAAMSVGAGGRLSMSGGSTVVSGVSVQVAGASVGIQEGSPTPPTGIADYVSPVSAISSIKAVATSASVLSSLKTGLVTVAGAVQKVTDTINTVRAIQQGGISGAIGAVLGAAELGKQLNPLTQTLDKVRSAVSDVNTALYPVLDSVNTIGGLIGKDLYPKTSFIQGGLDKLDTAADRVNALYAPLDRFNDKVVALNTVSYQIDEMIQPLDELNLAVSSVNNIVNTVPNASREVLSIGKRLTNSLPPNSGIYTEY